MIPDLPGTKITKRVDRDTISVTALPIQEISSIQSIIEEQPSKPLNLRDTSGIPDPTKNLGQVLSVETASVEILSREGTIAPDGEPHVMVIRGEISRLNKLQKRISLTKRQIGQRQREQLHWILRIKRTLK